MDGEQKTVFQSPERGKFHEHDVCIDHESYKTTVFGENRIISIDNEIDSANHVGADQHGGQTRRRTDNSYS